MIIFIFYTNKTIISFNFFSKNTKINNKLKDIKLIYWYIYFSTMCQKFLPPNFKISKNFYVYFSLINVDIIILKIIRNKNPKIYEDWKKIILNQKIPKNF